MTGVQTCALPIYELGHCVLGHDPAATGWIKDRQERDADQWAARLLISAVEYRAAEHLHGPHPGAIAAELEVTKHLVEVWREHHLTATAPSAGTT